MQDKIIQRHTLRVGDFRPFTPAYDRAFESEKVVNEEVIISHTHDYGDAFLDELRKSYPNIPMHGRFRKYGTDYHGKQHIGRETISLVYSIREGNGLMKRLSLFTKELIILRRGPFNSPSVIIHDQELQMPENVQRIERIINDTNKLRLVKFVLDRDSIESHVDN